MKDTTNLSKKETAKMSPNSKGKRVIHTFPEIDEFYYLLQDRLHMLLERFFFLEQRIKFTIFINAFPRRQQLDIERGMASPSQLSYTGILRQRELLEGEDKSYWKDYLNQYWESLQGHLDLNPQSPKAITLKKTLQHKLHLNDLRPNVLKDYFSTTLRKSANESDLPPSQQAEYHILKEYFDLENGYYLSLPLIGFGEVDGVVHIFFEQQAYKLFFKSSKGGGQDIVKTNLINDIILGFNNEYEGLILDWDLVGENIEKKTVLKNIFSDDFFNQIATDPILSNLRFHEYYKRYRPYFEKRFTRSDFIPEYIYKSYLKVAVISILVDSYAHNVSAHSLTALNWMLKQRVQYLRTATVKNHSKKVKRIRELLDNSIKMPSEDNAELRQLLEPWLSAHLPNFPQEEAEQKKLPLIIGYDRHLSNELQPLINFLAEKGAFWSGVTRDFNFGGETATLFDILWNGFVSNPLYLGTIATSEDISRINIDIVFYEPEEELSPKRRCIKENKKVFKGRFAIIDIDEARPEDIEDEDALDFYVPLERHRLYHKQYRELENRSNFIQPGPDYVRLKKMLQEIRIFFPGGIVGRHSFFTILENEIRNVKHFSGEDLKNMQINGLTLVLAVQETDIHTKKGGEKELYKLGIWMDVVTELFQVQATLESPYLVKRRYDALLTPIMARRTFNPMLGGSFQDKICAAMLFNNVFSQVQNGDEDPFRPTKDKDSERDKMYYPWVMSAAAPVDNPYRDFELSRRNSCEDEDFVKLYEKIGPKRGFFKKHFFVWKGKEVYDVQAKDIHMDQFMKWENLSRFRFIRLQGKDEEIEEARNKARSAGVIRIIEGTSKADGLLTAYEEWLPTWLGPKSRSLQLEENPTENTFAPIGTIEFDGALRKVHFTETPSLKSTIVRRLQIAHSGASTGKNVIRFRSHGAYKQYFRKEGLSTKVQQARMAEFLETMETEVCIFDNRVRHRIRSMDTERDGFARNILKLVVHSEQCPFKNKIGKWESKWESELERSIPKCHLLAVHLAYIDRILQTKYTDLEEEEKKNMEESTLGFFIEKEILPAITSKDGKIRNNFVFVVTTGRGRTEWWDKLLSSGKYARYQHLVTFRSVESIIAVMENAISKQDDIELKYELVKVLMGG